MKRQSTSGIALLVIGGSMLLGIGSARGENAFLSEKSAHTGVTLADHQRLANYYRAKAQESRNALAKQERLVAFWGQKLWMESRLKLPNPYWSAKMQASAYRAETQKWSSRAAEQDRIVQTLSKSSPRP